MVHVQYQTVSLPEARSSWSHGGFRGGTPIVGWFTRENQNLKWMIGGYSRHGEPHMFREIEYENLI